MAIDTKDPKEQHADWKAPDSEIKDANVHLLELAKQRLLEILDRTSDNAEDDPEAVAMARKELRQTFEKFPLLIPAYSDGLRKALNELQVDVGKLSVYMVGGRVIGKPLSSHSDIDQIFAVEKPISKAFKENYELRQAWVKKRIELLKSMAKLCEENGISNIIRTDVPGRFQVLHAGWCVLTPDNLEKNKVEGEGSLLLYQET